jgi:hypothetical protein
MGARGSLRGNRAHIDEAPFRLWAADGNILYLSGTKRLWAYDAVRGGLHTVMTWPTSNDRNRHAGGMVASHNSADEPIMVFLNQDDVYFTKSPKTLDLDTVTNFGDDEAHYILTSNFFDGNLPMEIKELSKVAIQRDPGNANTEWTVQVSVDEGAWADVLVHSATGQVYASAELSGTSGYRFQYRVIYQTKTQRRDALRALMITMNTGEKVTEWRLMVDGTEMLNIDNEIVDPEAFLTSLEASMSSNAQVDFVDNYKGRQEVDSATSEKVKLMGIIVNKEDPDEAMIQVVLREA